MRLHILSLALGGCLRPEPVKYGITEDTGGHITYILGEMTALSKRDDVSLAEIVTRRFDEPTLGRVHAQPEQWVNDKLVIRRIDSGNRRYLAKEELGADRAAFIAAFLDDLRSRERLPDLIHAHFADAADVAFKVQRELGIPYIYTAHSLGMDKRDTFEGEQTHLDDRIAEEDAAIAGARAVIGSSRDECERQLLSYPSARIDRIHRITPGISQLDATEHSVEQARALIAPFLRDEDKPIVLAIARPVQKKNLAGLIDAFGQDDWLRQNANLVILAGQRDDLTKGEAEHAAVLQDIVDAIDRHDLYGSVAYPKRHTRELADGFYALAARSGGVFVNPAKVEPYGLTVVEAAVHGLPVVATKIGGPTDIVGELWHGELVDPYDRQSIADGIRALLKDRTRWEQCSRNGRTRVRAMTWDRYAEGFMTVAAQVTARPAAVAVMRPRLDALIVSDIDNTLTGCLDGAARFSSFLKGNPNFAFVAATGRSLPEARRVIREWKLPTPLAWITSVGSEIYFASDDGLVLDRTYAHAIDQDWDAEAVTRALENMPGVRPQAGYEQRAYKRSYYVDSAKDAARVHARLAKAGVRGKVVFSHGSLLDILPPLAGKGAALNHVADRFDVEPANVFAAGDSGNDECMLTACANAILVGNYSAELAPIVGRTNVYVARERHAGGVLEGIDAHRSRLRSLRSAA